MTWVFSQYNARYDWLILSYSSAVMHAGRLRARNNQAKSQIINYTLTSIAQSLQENLKTPALRSVNTARSRAEIFP